MADRLEFHRSGSTMWLDMLEIEVARRGRGLGRARYQRFEAGLPADITTVRVFAADTEGSGNSDGFWLSLGFAYRFEGRPDQMSYEAAHTLVKGVNGHPNPAPIKAS
jgi:hypothetical protein